MEEQSFNLMELVVHPHNISRAYRQVTKRKDTASGVDGMRVAEFSIYLNQHWVSIQKSLVEGKYRPELIRGVKIPKPNGGYRQLGIPTLIDRLIQQSLNQVLNLKWDKDFSVFSYGFRPARNAHQALEQANTYINEGYQQIIDLDLKAFFDRVNHDKLMGLLSRKVKDKRVLRLIHNYLKSGLLQDGIIQARRQGTPQGGPLSPLLSNILLDELDKELTKRGHRFVRYADDCSIFLRSKRAAQRVKRSITRFLEKKLHLQVNQEKTSICRPLKYELLGHSFTPTYQKGSKGKYRLSISSKSWKKLKEKIKLLTKKTAPIPLRQRITRLNQLMVGWVNYFKNATGFQKLKELDSWVRCRLRYCIWKQWKRPRKRYKAFIQLGVQPSWARRFAWSRKGGWRVACSPIMGTTVTLERLRKRGYIPFLEYYSKVKYPKL